MAPKIPAPVLIPTLPVSQQIHPKASYLWHWCAAQHLEKQQLKHVFGKAAFEASDAETSQKSLVQLCFILNRLKEIKPKETILKHSPITTSLTFLVTLSLILGIWSESFKLSLTGLFSKWSDRTSSFYYLQLLHQETTWSSTPAHQNPSTNLLVSYHPTYEDEFSWSPPIYKHANCNPVIASPLFYWRDVKTKAKGQIYFLLALLPCGAAWKLAVGWPSWQVHAKNC